MGCRVQHSRRAGSTEVQGLHGVGPAKECTLTQTVFAKPSPPIMAETVDVKPELIRWAVQRSGLPLSELTAKFPKLEDWQRGERQPTFNQLEEFARRTMTPFGYLFLHKP